MLIGWHVWFSNGELAVLYCHFTLLVMLQFFGFAMWHWGVLAKDVLWHWIAFQLFTCPWTICIALVCVSILGGCWWFFCLVRTLWAYPWQDFVATCILPKVRSWVFTTKSWDHTAPPRPTRLWAWIGAPSIEVGYGSFPRVWVIRL